MAGMVLLALGATAGCFHPVAATEPTTSVPSSSGSSITISGSMGSTSSSGSTAGTSETGASSSGGSSTAVVVDAGTPACLVPQPEYEPADGGCQAGCNPQTQLCAYGHLCYPLACTEICCVPPTSTTVPTMSPDIGDQGAIAYDVCLCLCASVVSPAGQPPGLLEACHAVASGNGYQVAADGGTVVECDWDFGFCDR